jgi:predicted N-acetyltransferase YhbS
MIFSDIDKLVNEFALQGWLEKSTEQFTKYLNEQENNKRQVFIAEVDGSIAGYVTLLPNDKEGPFANKNIPTVCDFNVLIKYQRQGVGSALMDKVESAAKETSDTICLGVGLYTNYGAAQRMYVKRGYIPDGSGVWHQNKNLPPYAECRNDDDLVLYLSKKF